MNHVWVTVWPVVDLDLDALGALGTKISPLTDGASAALLMTPTSSSTCWLMQPP